MNLFEDTNPRALKELLGEIHNRMAVLPDFQRDFVWEPGATQELIVSIANNADTPLLRIADVAILLATPPEVVAGSTRMGAGTAQKIALNMLSTLSAVHLGHVHDGFMVNLRADNAKLRDRARRIVSVISGTDAERAGHLLDEADGSVKIAVLLAAGADGAPSAGRLLESCNQNLRQALQKAKAGS